MIPQVQMIHLNYLLFQIDAEIHGLGFSIYLLADILDYDKCDYVRRNHLMDFEIQGSKLYISVGICYVLKKAWHRWNITHYLRPCFFFKITTRLWPPSWISTNVTMWDASIYRILLFEVPRYSFSMRPDMPTWLLWHA